MENHRALISEFSLNSYLQEKQCYVAVQSTGERQLRCSRFESIIQPHVDSSLVINQRNTVIFQLGSTQQLNLSLPQTPPIQMAEGLSALDSGDVTTTVSRTLFFLSPPVAETALPCWDRLQAMTPL